MQAPGSQELLPHPLRPQSLPQALSQCAAPEAALRCSPFSLVAFTALLPREVLPFCRYRRTVMDGGCPPLCIVCMAPSKPVQTLQAFHGMLFEGALQRLRDICSLNFNPSGISSDGLMINARTWNLTKHL